jgi:hypothetical protein
MGYRLDELGPVLIAVRQFEYAGENLRARGTLAAVANRVRQVRGRACTGG